MKIGDEVYVHGFVDEIRKDVVIIRNEGGYFGTVPSETIDIVRCKECKWASPRSLPYETGYYCLFHRVWKGDNGYCDDGEREGE